MYWGPWLALSRSFHQLEHTVLLAVVQQMNTNMARLMTFLSPLSLLTTAGMALWYRALHLQTAFYLATAGFLLLLAAVVITVQVEVPIVKRMITWTTATLPADWEQQRDKWQRNHVTRVLCGLGGLILLLCAALL